jgi:hypothetical protein
MASPGKRDAIPDQESAVSGSLHQALETLRDGVIWRLRRAGIVNAQEAFEQIHQNVKFDCLIRRPNARTGFSDILIRVNSEIRRIELGHTQFPVPVCSVEAEALRRFYGTHESEEEICARLPIPRAELRVMRAAVRRCWRA